MCIEKTYLKVIGNLLFRFNRLAVYWPLVIAVLLHRNEKIVSSLFSQEKKSEEACLVIRDAGIMLE